MEPVTGLDEYESGPDQRERHSDAVSDDEQYAKPGPSQRDAAEEDDQGGGARDKAAGEADGEEAAGAGPFTAGGRQVGVGEDSVRVHPVELSEAVDVLASVMMVSPVGVVVVWR